MRLLRRGAAHGDDLNSSTRAFAVALGDHAFELGESQMHHAAVPRVHRFEGDDLAPVSYTHLRAHETVLDIRCRLLLEKKKK